jgi:hypothetical protein
MTNENPDSAAYQKSWDDVVEFYEQLCARRQWEHDAPLLRLTKTSAQSERATRFRAGEGDHHTGTTAPAAARVS